jgi:hypothetical protein
MRSMTQTWIVMRSMTYGIRSMSSSAATPFEMLLEECFQLAASNVLRLG